MRWKSRRLPVSTLKPSESAVSPISKSPNGITTPRLCCSPSIFPARRAVSFKENALLAGKIDGEQQSRGVVIPFGDLLIGDTALSLGFKVLTGNLRDFQRIPGLTVMQF